MSKKQINCLLVYNTDSQFLTSNAKANLFKEYVPSGTCPQEIYQLCTRDINEVVEFTEKYPIDLIIQYGLGNGLLWESDEFRNIQTLSNDYTFVELVGAENKLKSTVHPQIAAAYAELDSKKSWPDRVMIAKTKDDLAYILGRCKKESYGLDTETNFLNPFIRDPAPFLVCFSVAWHSDEEECWCIPTCEKLIKAGDCEFTVEESLELASSVFFECDQPQDWQNFHYDGLVLWELFGGRTPKNFRADTMLLFSLYHKAMKSASLAENVQMLGLPAYKEAAKEWIAAQPKKKKGQPPYTFADVPIEIIGPYAAVDALAVVRATNFMRKNLPTEQWAFYFKVAHEVLLCSIALCVEGYEISQDRYNYTKLEAEKNIITTYKDCIDVVKDHVDSNFNVGSNKQLGTLLFDKLKLPVLQKTNKGAAATGAKVLDDLILFHPFIFYLLKLKKLQKLYTSYVLGYTNVLGPGSRVFPTNSNWIFNSQLKQINRTARLGASNMYGHKGTKKKGGNVLTLPGAGSMIKHYFEAKEVVSLENELYTEILATIEKSDPEKYKALLETLSQDATTITKPEKVKKERKKKAKKDDTDTNEQNEDDVEIIPLDNATDTELVSDEYDVPWDE